MAARRDNGCITLMWMRDEKWQLHECESYSRLWFWKFDDLIFHGYVEEGNECSLEIFTYRHAGWKRCVYIDAKLQSYGKDLCIRDSELARCVGLCAYVLIYVHLTLERKSANSI